MFETQGGHAESNPRPSEEGVSFYHVLRICASDAQSSSGTPHPWFASHPHVATPNAASLWLGCCPDDVACFVRSRCKRILFHTSGKELWIIPV